MAEDNIKPGKVFYILALAVFVLGMAASLYQLFQGLSDDGMALQQVVVPGKSELVLDEAGNYTINHEYRSSINGKIYDSNANISGLRCRLTDRSSGKEIALQRPKVDSSYSFGGRAGRGVLEFAIDSPGTYELSAWYEGNRGGPEVVLAVGEDFVVFKTLIYFIMEILVIMAVSAAIALVTYLRREKFIKTMNDNPL